VPVFEPWIPISVMTEWCDAVRHAQTDDQRQVISNQLWANSVRSKMWLIHALQPYASECRHGMGYVWGCPLGLLASCFAAVWGPTWPIAMCGVTPLAMTLIPQIAHTARYYPDPAWTRVLIPTDPAYMVYPTGRAFVRPSLIIHTNVEKMSDATFTAWWATIPMNTCVVLQGNNYTQLAENLRPMDSLSQFYETLITGRHETYFLDRLPCEGFDRFMWGGRKV